jgi:hypothetical protein
VAAVVAAEEFFLEQAAPEEQDVMAAPAEQADQ